MKQSEWFEPRDNGRQYAVASPVKKGITWKQHNLLSELPGTGFHIIFLRNNLLTYYKDEIKIPAFKNVLESLSSGGYLIVGSHEKLPAGFPNLSPVSGHSCIFQKQS